MEMFRSKYRTSTTYTEANIVTNGGVWRYFGFCLLQFMPYINSANKKKNFISMYNMYKQFQHFVIHPLSFLIKMTRIRHILYTSYDIVLISILNGDVLKCFVTMKQFIEKHCFFCLVCNHDDDVNWMKIHTNILLWIGETKRSGKLSKVKKKKKEHKLTVKLKLNKGTYCCIRVCYRMCFVQNAFPLLHSKHIYYNSFSQSHKHRIKIPLLQFSYRMKDFNFPHFFFFLSFFHSIVIACSSLSKLHTTL